MTDLGPVKYFLGDAYFIRILEKFGLERHETVALSTIEAEYTALSQGARELAWIRNLFSELQLPLNVPILLNGDNQGSLKLCRNPELHQQTKHIPFVEHHIREEIEAGNIDVQYVSTHEQIADGLAKPLDAASHGLLKQFELVQAQLKKDFHIGPSKTQVLEGTSRRYKASKVLRLQGVNNNNNNLLSSALSIPAQSNNIHPDDEGDDSFFFFVCEEPRPADLTRRITGL
ncbi:hypothetical protein MRS44_008426 [Fusarium solani]|uniref:uncharacterized protein n=1 Tax=Fusarium solani TaxID=169388 RepID=UPI0032C408AB|nr:hypothetical protein MRS44_008426 [Fusarium solani]